MTDRFLAVCAWFLFADAVWPMVLAAVAATKGDYGGLILMPPICAVVTFAGVTVWHEARSEGRATP